MFSFRTTNLKKWAEQNNLKYQKKVNLGFFNSENVSLDDLIWGEYKGKKIYIFNFTDSTGQFSQTKTYFNGCFYSEIKEEDVDQLLENKYYLEIKGTIFGNETAEIIQVLVAQIFLDTNKELEYDIVKKIYNFLRKFHNSKTTFKEKMIGVLTGTIKRSIKLNSPEAIDFVKEKSKNELDQEIIQLVGDTYEKLLNSFNGNNSSTSSSENPLDNINMEKFQ